MTNPKKIWLASPNMGGQEINFVNEAFSSNWVSPVGPNIDGFENDICNYTKIKHATALSSGTAAIHLALKILGVQQGDDILCSSFTFSASANPIVYEKATPVFIDSESETWNLDPDLLEKAILERKRLGKNMKALILVHLYGIPAKLDQILPICSKHNIAIIEDAAEALGSTYRNRALGSFGDIGIFSFNGNKIITTSGGGMMVSSNALYTDKARFLSTQSRDPAPHYQHSEIGYNYRMSNVCAGIGRGQMLVLDERIRQKRKIHAFYSEIFGNQPGIKLLGEPQNSFSNAWLSCVTIDPIKTNFSNEDLRLEFEKNNIESRPLWKPMHLQPVFAKYPSFTSGVAESIFNTGLCLPSDTNMDDADLKSIKMTIETLLSK